MTNTDDLTTWLRQQLDEDEMVAAEAIQATTGRWTARETDWGGGTVVEDDSGALILPTTRTHGATQYPHIAEHDPARVLRAVAAKRAVLQDLANCEFTLSVAGPGTPPHDLMTGAVNLLKRTVSLLAAEYTDRPGWREEWRS